MMYAHRYLFELFMLFGLFMLSIMNVNALLSRQTLVTRDLIYLMYKFERCCKFLIDLNSQFSSLLTALQFVEVFIILDYGIEF